MIIVSGRARFRPDATAQVWSLIDAVVPPTRAEAGCRDYSYFVDRDRPDAIFFFEQWEDQAALDAHLQAPHTQQFLSAIFALLAERPEVTRREVTSSGPLFP